ncbi:hypothetical protein CF319_g9439, partial [Tilletia indica]
MTEPEGSDRQGADVTSAAVVAEDVRMGEEGQAAHAEVSAEYSSAPEGNESMSIDTAQDGAPEVSAAVTMETEAESRMEMDQTTDNAEEQPQAEAESGTDKPRTRSGRRVKPPGTIGKGENESALVTARRKGSDGPSRVKALSFRASSTLEHTSATAESLPSASASGRSIKSVKRPRRSAGKADGIEAEAAAPSVPGPSPSMAKGKLKGSEASRAEEPPASYRGEDSFDSDADAEHKVDSQADDSYKAPAPASKAASTKRKPVNTPRQLKRKRTKTASSKEGSAPAGTSTGVGTVTSASSVHAGPRPPQSSPGKKSSQQKTIRFILGLPSRSGKQPTSEQAPRTGTIAQQSKAPAPKVQQAFGAPASASAKNAIRQARTPATIRPEVVVTSDSSTSASVTASSAAFPSSSLAPYSSLAPP